MRSINCAWPGRDGFAAVAWHGMIGSAALGGRFYQLQIGERFMSESHATDARGTRQVDAVVIGAGFAGLYAARSFRRPTLGTWARISPASRGFSYPISVASGRIGSCVRRSPSEATRASASPEVAGARQGRAAARRRALRRLSSTLGAFGVRVKTIRTYAGSRGFLVRNWGQSKNYSRAFGVRVKTIRS